MRRILTVLNQFIEPVKSIVQLPLALVVLTDYLFVFQILKLQLMKESQ